MRDGLYDKLITAKVAADLNTAPLEGQVRATVSEDELVDYLVGQLSSDIRATLSAMTSDQERVQLANELASMLASEVVPTDTPEILRGLVADPAGDKSILGYQPELPLRQLALLTNAKAEPKVGQAIQTELRSADRVDILMAFVKVSGLRLIYEQLRQLADRGVRVRLITSCYMGATELDAVIQLVRDLNVEVRIDYLARANRLHAKAWLLERNTGFTTAYIGSSNMSRAAMWDGLEWNVRFSEEKAPEIIGKMRAAFESYWNSKDFEGFTDSPGDIEKLEEALARTKNINNAGSSSLTLSMLDVKPWPYQQDMLDELWVEREVHDRHSNLVVAATGTGKTVLSALDYQRLSGAGARSRLLFVAHTREILEQACSTFRQVMKDGNFGELWVDGVKPTANLHLFASVQTLNSNNNFQRFQPNQFDVIIIDEFHHATADTYAKIIDYFQPKELIGLTATPERANGVRVQDEYFGGRIASELRLWDALDQELLTPFNYFGISDGVDYTQVDWSKGSYNGSAISKLLTADTVRARLVFNELIKKYGDLSDLKALAFCAGKDHAKFMTEFFSSHGLEAACVLGDTSSEERAASISKFKAGQIKVLVSVGVFNEGFDAPDANAILMLRPTESPIVFLQQLGRGLRKSSNKESVLVLDFVGNHRSEYRQDLRLSIMSGRSRGELEQDLKSGFPYLPSGVSITLDKKTRDGVLASIKKQVAPSESSLFSEVASIAADNLSDYLEKSGRELWEIYRHSGLSWTKLNSPASAHIGLSPRLGKIRNFIHVNDVERIDAYSELLSGSWPGWLGATDQQKRYAYMFLWNFLSGETPDVDSLDTFIGELSGDRQFCSELTQLLEHLRRVTRTRTFPVTCANFDSPFQAHANYTRAELLGGAGWSTLPKSGLAHAARTNATSKPSDHREGVAWLPGVATEILFVTLKKGSAFSSTTSYHDYAENQEIFHWDTQNRVRDTSETGQRYINHAARGVDVLLAIRETNEAFKGFTPTFRMAGLVDYQKHAGNAPMSIWWKLRQPLDLETWKLAAAVRVA